MLLYLPSLPPLQSLEDAALLNYGLSVRIRAVLLNPDAACHIKLKHYPPCSAAHGPVSSGALQQHDLSDSIAGTFTFALSTPTASGPSAAPESSTPSTTPESSSPSTNFVSQAPSQYWEQVRLSALSPAAAMHCSCNGGKAWSWLWPSKLVGSGDVLCYNLRIPASDAGIQSSRSRRMTCHPFGCCRPRSHLDSTPFPPTQLTCFEHLPLLLCRSMESSSLSAGKGATLQCIRGVHMRLLNSSLHSWLNFCQAS